MRRPMAVIATGTLAGVVATSAGAVLAAKPRPMAGAAQGAESLPPGVKRIAFGTRYETKEASGGLHCTVKQPLPAPPVFPGGTAQISFVIEVDPEVVQSLNASVVGDLGSREIKSEGCNEYGVCRGRLCQKQYGSSVSRVDGKPLQPGSFKLQLKVGAKQYEVPFEIK